MLVRKAFKFQLKPKFQHMVKMRQFAGCCRFVWNKALALEQETYNTTGSRNGYCKLCNLLVEWKKSQETIFLKDVHSQILQQTLKDLDRAYINFFEEQAEFPKFKKKGLHDSFRYPQGFKVDENNSRVFLPKIGWVKYRDSRNVEGIVKQITVSFSCGHWYVSIQTEINVAESVHNSQSVIGIDMGITNFATLSDGKMVKPVNSCRKYEKKLAKLQRILSRRIKFSSNWRKIKTKIQNLHKKIADVRRDFLHKTTNDLCKNHAMIVVEDFKVKSMSKSASGTIEKPGRNVKAKSGLNKSILDQGWGEFVRQLMYKLEWLGGQLIKVNPQYTSQKCSCCGYTHKDNRPSQAVFKCDSCGYENNADVNAAKNILAAGLAVLACPQ